MKKDGKDPWILSLEDSFRTNVNGEPLKIRSRLGAQPMLFFPAHNATKNAAFLRFATICGKLA